MGFSSQLQALDALEMLGVQGEQRHVMRYRRGGDQVVGEVLAPLLAG